MGPGDERMNARREKAWLALLIVAFGLLCLSHLPVSYMFDGTVFAHYLRFALVRGDLGAVLQPQHLLYHPLAYGSYRLLNLAAGYRVLEYFHLQLLSLAFALASLVTAWFILRRIVLDPPLRLVAVALLAGSYSFWLQAVEAEVHMPALFFSLAGLAALGFSSRRVRGVLLAGFCFALAAGFHLTAILLFATGLAWLIWQRRSAFHIFLFLSIFTAALAVPYLLAATAMGLDLKRWAWSTLFHNVSFTDYAVSDWSPFRWSTLRLSLDAVAGSLLFPHGLLLRWGSRLLLLGGAAAVFWSQTRTRRRGETSLLVLWLSSFFVFFTFWHPGNPEFKLPVSVPLIILAVLFLSTRKNLSWPRIAAGALAALVLILNFVFGLSPLARSENNRDYILAEAIRQKTPADAEVVIVGSLRGFGMGKIYLPYFALRPALVLDWLVREHSYEPVKERIGRELAAGKKIFLFSDAASLTPAVRELLKNHALSPERHEEFLAALRRGRRIDLPAGEFLFEIVGTEKAIPALR